MKRSTLILAVVATTLLGTAAVYGETLEETVERTLPFAAGNRLSVSNTNGDVEIAAWDRDEIQIEARKKVRASSSERAEEAFEDLQINISESSDGVTIETEYPRRSGGWWGGVR